MTAATFESTYVLVAASEPCTGLDRPVIVADVPAFISNEPLMVTLLNALFPEPAVTLPVTLPTTLPVTLPPKLPVTLPVTAPAIGPTKLVALTVVPTTVLGEAAPICTASMLPPLMSTLANVDKPVTPKVPAMVAFS